MSDVLARSESPRGEVVLLRRERDGELELRVNGVFVMDTRETSTERAIAVLALDEIEQARPVAGLRDVRVLVGGLGLGFTLAALLRNPEITEIEVVEIEPAVVGWHQDGLIPHTAGIIEDPRVWLRVGDVRDVVGARSPGSLDAIVLDVDNGPGYLVYDANATLYETDFLTSCRSRLAPAGRLVVWSAQEASGLNAALSHVFGSADLHHMAVQLGNRSETYAAYVAPARSVGDGGSC